MIRYPRIPDSGSILLVIAAMAAAAFGGLVVVFAPVLLALPALMIIATIALFISVRLSRKAVGTSKLAWPAYALTMFWIVTINVPAIVAFDPTGLNRQDGLFNPQSLARIGVFLMGSVATLVFWSAWGKTSKARHGQGMAVPAGLAFGFSLYFWYLVTSPFVASDVTALLLSVFRVMEWMLALSLLGLVFAVQTAEGATSYRDRLKLLVPVLFFLVFSNLVLLPLVPGLVYQVSTVSGVGRLGGFFTHPNLLALAAVILCAYGLGFLSGWQRLLLVVITTTTLVFTYSRGGFMQFAVMVGLAVLLLVRGVGLRIGMVLAGSITILFALQFPQIDEKVSNVLSRGTNSENVGTLSERTAVWEAGKIVYARSPWFGNGFISGPKQIADVMLERRFSTNFAAPHAHNEFLQALISGGPVALGLSVLLHLRLVFLMFAVRSLKSNERFFSWTVWFTGALWGILQPSVSYLLLLPGVMLLWLLLTLESMRSLEVAQRRARLAPIAPRPNHAAQLQGSSASRGIAGVAVLTIALLGSALPAKMAHAGAPFGDKAFVTVDGGHLARDGQRVRVWGVNVQSGAFKTYAEIDALIARIGELGFNGLRLWPVSGTFYRTQAGGGATLSASRQGDGSDLDRFDYFVALASRNGINLQMPMLHYLDLPTLRSLPEPAIAEMVRAARDDAMLRRLHGFAPYVSAGYKERLKLHMRRVLARRNPYTNRRYVDEPAVSSWELANEAEFVHCATSPDCLKNLPPIALTYLNSAWRASPHNADSQALPVVLEDIRRPALFAAYSRFVHDQFIAVSNELRDTAREVGGPGSGIEVQPFIFNTNPGERAPVALASYGAGDVASVSAYSSPLVAEGGYGGSPWLPWSAGGKPIPVMEYVKLKDKPFVIYEGSFFRPYPFRAEWGVMMAAVALRQDWDGAFFYSYGQPGNIYSLDEMGMPKYGTKPLPDPLPGDTGERGTYAFGFHHGGDPVAMASWSVGAHLFLGTPVPSGLEEAEVVWDIPMFDPATAAAGYPSAFLQPSNTQELPRSKSFALRMSQGPGPCRPCVTQRARPSTVEIDWNRASRLITVRTPGGVAIAGDLRGNLGNLGAGVSAQVSKPGFGVVARLRPLQANSPGEVLMVIGDVQNSGDRFDAARARANSASPAGAMFGMQSRGTLPLRYSGPELNFSFDRPRSHKTVDFNLLDGRLEAPTGTLVYSGMPPPFKIELGAQ